jgi:hypothetical protein
MKRTMMSRLLAFLLPIGLMRFSVDGSDGGGAGGSGGAGGDGKPAGGNNDNDTKEHFSREYVKELREENKNWRLKASTLEQESATHKTAAEKAAQESEAKVKAAETAANDRILRSELKAAALKAGMIDLDGLKLADLSKVTLKDDGTVDGADTMLEEMKKSKPYLFGSTQNSSNPSKPPASNPPSAKNAKEMTAEEYAAARKAIK